MIPTKPEQKNFGMGKYTLNLKNKTMGEIAEELINQEMFGFDDVHSYNRRGNKKPKGKYRKTAYIHLTPSERKIASIRKEIAIDIKSGTPVEDARRKANLKYGKGWRERGLIVNSDNQWSENDLKEFVKPKN